MIKVRFSNLFELVVCRYPSPQHDFGFPGLAYVTCHMSPLSLCQIKVFREKVPVGKFGTEIFLL